jgi:hypothetical protein
MGSLQGLECTREAPPQETLAHEIGICANPKTVSELKTMFPNLSEYQIAQALQANDEDKGGAISSLLTATPTTVSRSPLVHNHHNHHKHYNHHHNYNHNHIRNDKNF